jgi:hypothetical protein
METFIYKFYLKNINLCEELIEYHKHNTEYKIDGTTSNGIDKNVKDSVDVIFYNDSKNKTIINYFNELSSGVKEYINKYNLKSNFSTSLANNIQFYPKNGGFKVWHCERQGQPLFKNILISSRALVYMTYLNDITDKGETEFLYQKIKIKPKKGLTLIWPSDFTHTHRGIPSLTQEKYIVTGWLNIVP